MIKVSARYVKAIYPFIAPNDIRYYLNGIAIDPHQDGGAVLRATNGHVAAIIYDKEAVCEESVLVKLDKSVLPHCLAKGKERFLIVDGKRASIRDASENEFYIQPNDCRIDYNKYPSFETLVPKTLVLGAPGQYSPTYIDYFCKQKHNYQGLTFFHNPESPETSVLVIRNNAMPEFIGLLMPMRGEKTLEPVPSWWNTSKPELV
jgi:hypothetical protein